MLLEIARASDFWPGNQLRKEPEHYQCKRVLACAMLNMLAFVPCAIAHAMFRNVRAALRGNASDTKRARRHFRGPGIASEGCPYVTEVTTSSHTIGTTGHRPKAHEVPLPLFFGSFFSREKKEQFFALPGSC